MKPINRVMSQVEIKKVMTGSSPLGYDDKKRCVFSKVFYYKNKDG